MQSNTTDPVAVDKRIEAHLAAIKDLLTSMPDEEFEDSLEALIAVKLEKPKNLKKETDLYFVEISTPKAYIFDRSTPFLSYV